MGGFLLIRKQDSIRADEFEGRYSDSIGVFDKKGLSLNRRFATPDFSIYVFNKYRSPVENVVQFSNTEFIIATGTCIYNKKIGHDALTELYHDFSEDGRFLTNLLGHYCIIIAKNGKTFLVNDDSGLFRSYASEKKDVISSSFIAVLKALEKRSIASQELYEYIFNGASFGDKTLINEINLIDSSHIWQLSPEFHTITKPNNTHGISKRLALSEVVEEMSTSLIDYFDIIQDNFGNDLCSALTGGHDSRLLLALMRKVGIQPQYLYVYDDSRQPTCVSTAMAMANGENLSLDYVNLSKFSDCTSEEYAELLQRKYYVEDGLGHENGIFDNGTGLMARLNRTEKARLHLNGGLGEIFRNFWLLPHNTLTTRAFIESKYDLNFSACTEYHDRESYIAALSEKIKNAIQTQCDRLNQRQIAALFPFWVGKYWTSSNNSINNQLSYALTPFGESRFVHKALDIPIRYRNYGIFETALIKFIDPKLAKYPSHYGYNFYDGMSRKTKMKAYIKLHIPIQLKRYARKHFWNADTKRLVFRRQQPVLPFYLTEEYLDRIFNNDILHVAEYVHINQIKDIHTLSRALTAELVISNRY